MKKIIRFTDLGENEFVLVHDVVCHWVWLAYLTMRPNICLSSASMFGVTTDNYLRINEYIIKYVAEEKVKAIYTSSFWTLPRQLLESSEVSVFVTDDMFKHNDEVMNQLIGEIQKLKRPA
ncbi:MAG: hypothetical protein WCF94_01170 [bacterium]